MRDPAKFCSVDGCEKLLFCKGYCRLHHERWRKHGDPFVVLKGGSRKGSKQRAEDVARRAEANRRPLLQRFESKYMPEPNSGCWIWLGALHTENGYGQLRENRRNINATHVALKLADRPVPTGLFACHRCDTPCCVNPNHLFIGTQADNVADMIAKGRHDHSGLALGRGSRRGAILA